MKVAFQGVRGAYSEMAALKYFKTKDIKFLPKLTFVEDNSFEYAEKIERLIKKNNNDETEKKRHN